MCEANTLSRKHITMHIYHLSHLSCPSPCAGPASISVIQYFRHCAMSSVGRHFFMSPFIYPSISFSVDLCPFSQKRLVATISHRCGWVFVCSSGQTTFVFQDSFNRTKLRPHRQTWKYVYSTSQKDQHLQCTTYML